MAIKSVNRSACAAFAPEAPYLATGTMAGAVDLQFSSSANLDLFKLDFASDDQQLILAGSVPSSERFNRLSWGKPLPNSEEFSLGLVAGGLVDGNIGLWNPKTLIGGDGAFFQNLSRHRGPVRGLEFNTYSPNLLASGADEGEICIWDIANPSEPTHFPPLRGGGGGEISYLSWNSKVHHILASTSYNGTTVVWDLKKQKSLMSLNDSVRRRCSVLQWNPDIATELVVASDEDNSPSIRLWDLRNPSTPVKEFVGHTRGVIAMSWCPIDSSYLLSSAKDNRTILWDTTSGETVSEFPAGTNCNFDVHWYPRIPGVISASSYDGTIGLYNIEGCVKNGATSFRAPKWYKRGAGVSFGFGGKVASFNTSEGSSEVFVDNLVAEHNLASRCSEFEAAIRSGEKSCLRLLCEKKSEESKSVDEKEIWGFLKGMFAEDGTSTEKLLSHLGFSPAMEENNATYNDISDQVNALDRLDLNIDDGEDFFNNLSSPKAASANRIDSFPVEEEVKEEDGDQSFVDGVERALVVRDFKGAVSQCVSSNKIADALLIAHAADDAMLWESTRDEYLKTSSSRHLKVVSAMVNRDLMSLVKTRPLKSWKGTIALLCSFAPQDEWTLLCDTLAARLMDADKTLPATLCFICAGNIDKAMEIWSRTDLFEDMMEKAIVLGLASGKKLCSASLSYKLVGKYAEILASQGLSSTAMEFLKLLESSPELEVLQDLVARSMEPADQEIRHINVYQQPNETRSHVSQHPPPNIFLQPQISQPPPAVRVQPPVAPATIQTADTSNVADQLKPAVATLTRLFHETSEAAHPSKRREIDDSSRKLGALFVKLNSGDISRRAAEKLVEICQALDYGEFAKSIQLQTQLTATDWDECGAWLLTLKRMVRARQML